MFAVDHVLVSDALLDAPFACNLGACLGGCCVVGDSGAPLDGTELRDVEAALDVVRDRLRPEALAAIDQRGPWEGSARDGYAVTTVNGEECAFVVFDRGVAKCAIQQAHWRGELDFEKPLSCHLYPIRAETYGTGADAVDVLNYERIELCDPARPHGDRTGVQLADFLERPLTRKYGAGSFARFRETLRQRRADVGIGPQEPAPAP